MKFIKKFLIVPALSLSLLSSPASSDTKPDLESKVYAVAEEKCIKKESKKSSIGSLFGGVYGFIPMTERLKMKTPYMELGYQTPPDLLGIKGFSVKVAGGYMRLGGDDVNGTRRKYVDFLPVLFGANFKLTKRLEIEGGCLLANFLFEKKSVGMPSTWGGYAGVNYIIKKNKNFELKLKGRWQAADMELRYPLLEDETNITGWLGGIEIKW